LDVVLSMIRGNKIFILTKRQDKHSVILAYVYLFTQIYIELNFIQSVHPVKNVYTDAYFFMDI
jgi:hypothetical protein